MSSSWLIEKEEDYRIGLEIYRWDLLTLTLLSLKDSRTLTSEIAPGKFENWAWLGWGRELLEEANLYGPVYAKRSTGTWQGKKITIEVWEIIKADKSGYDYVVEASFKTMDYIDAAYYKKKLQQELTNQGWFLPIDELKTQIILERYKSVQ